ncbi:MAG: hypothetical protein ABIR18_03550 [Chitinophagaceae bacterium]
MQHLEDNMDELFRKAAENYPLKTDAQDWDDIAPVLVKASILNTPHKTGKRKHSGLLLFTFLFLATTLPLLITNKKSNLSGNIVTPGDRNKNVGRNKANSPDSSQKVNFVSIGLPGKTTYLVQKRDNAPLNGNSPRSGPGNRKVSEDLFTGLAFAKGTNSSTKKNSDTEEYYDRENTNNLSGKKMLDSFNIEVNNITLTTDLDSDKNDNNITGNDSSQQLLMTSVSDEKKSIKKAGFYFGIVGGPQLNQVKGQGFKKPGLSTGILIGYMLSRKISVETGMFYSTKHYYSEGKYFDMVKASPSMPSGMKVLSLKGKSAVVEVPVTLKYDFLKKIKSNLFLTVGVSSYLLTKESNDYLAVVNGNQQRMEGDYQKAAKYLAATINLSIGYDYKMGKQLSIRVEPYVQVPTKGIGVGAMPVSSVGLHTGIIWNHR